MLIATLLSDFLTTQACLKLLLIVSQECEGDEQLEDLIVAALHGRSKPQDVPLMLVPIMSVNVIVGTRLISKLIAPSKPQTPFAPTPAPGWFLRSRMEALYIASIADLPFSGVPRLTPPIHSSLNTDTILVSSEGTELHAHGWVLYARWPYYRNLTTLNNSTLPALVRDTMVLSTWELRVLLIYIYTQRVIPRLAHEARHHLLQHAQHFMLVLPQSPAIPDPQFKRLIDYCREIHKVPLSIENCFIRYEEARKTGSLEEVAQVAQFMLNHSKELYEHPQLRAQLLELGLSGLGGLVVHSWGKSVMDLSF